MYLTVNVTHLPTTEFIWTCCGWVNVMNRLCLIEHLTLVLSARYWVEFDLVSSTRLCLIEHLTPVLSARYWVEFDLVSSTRLCLIEHLTPVLSARYWVKFDLVSSTPASIRWSKVLMLDLALIIFSSFPSSSSSASRHCHSLNRTNMTRQRCLVTLLFHDSPHLLWTLSQVITAC
jgi:hypothetical protein